MGRPDAISAIPHREGYDPVLIAIGTASNRPRQVTFVLILAPFRSGVRIDGLSASQAPSQLVATLVAKWKHRAVRDLNPRTERSRTNPPKMA